MFEKGECGVNKCVIKYLKAKGEDLGCLTD